MVKTLFEYSDYRPYLIESLGGTGVRNGRRNGLAQATNTNSAFVSQVLSGKAHFSLEQAQKANKFFEHSFDESHFFMLLVQYTRAGTHELKKYFKNQIESVREQRLNIQKRLGVKKRLSAEDQAQYYSTWYYAAVHVALSIAQLRKPEAMAEYLGLKVGLIKDILNFLIEVGLAKRGADGQVVIGDTHIHLGKDSKNINRHHSNWRWKAIQNIESGNQEDLHYSSAVTISKSDANAIKDLIIENLKSINTRIIESKEEEVFVFNFDFFNIKN